MIDPMLLITVGIGIAFLLILIDRINRGLSVLVFSSTLLIFTIASGVYFYVIVNGGGLIESVNAGIAAPIGINFRIGLEEAAIMLCVNLLMTFSTLYLSKRFRETTVAGMVLFLMMTVGINGVIMTRDLFNMFVFIEIFSIATYSFIALDRDRETLTAGFKYIIAGSLASSFLLLGIILVYHVSGNLNIDVLFEQKVLLERGTGFIALFFIIIALLIELKPFPANGWALDVYESAENGSVAVIAVGHTAAVLSALYKTLPLMPEKGLTLVFWAGLITFLLSNLGGIKQRNVKRMLGFSSAAQLGLISSAIALTIQTGMSFRLLIIIAGGLFANHFFAKASLFWLAGIVGKYKIDEWRALRSSPLLLIIFGIALFALVGLPPFPGFFAKWHLVKALVRGSNYFAIFTIGLGTLFEGAYLLNWFGVTVATEKSGTTSSSLHDRALSTLLPPFIFSQSLVVCGLLFCTMFGLLTPQLAIPLFAALAFYSIEAFPAKVKGIIALLVIGVYGWHIVLQLDSFRLFFAVLLLGGSAVMTIGTLNRSGKERGFFPFYILCILSLGALLTIKTLLQFFYMWELMAVSSYLLVLRGKTTRKPAWLYIMFSLAGAFMILTGFSMLSPSNEIALYHLLHGSGVPLALILGGLLIKAAAIGIHIWLPGMYAESDDDLSAFFSAVLSKVGIYGLMTMLILFGIQKIGPVNITLALSWIGILTAFFGTLMAVFQEDIKYLLAYSSMGQIGYIILAAAMMDHMGWVTALYLSVNHFLFKGLLFLAFAGVLYRTKTRLMYRMGGLIKRMPFSFVSVLMAIIALSGVPPLSGFGGKWLLFTGLLEKGWYFQLALAFFSSTIAFLYCFRLIHTVFLGQEKAEFKEIRKAPLWLLLPQFILIGCIMAISMMPHLILKPIIAAVTDWYPSTLRWSGSTLISGLGYWNGFLVMNVVMVMFGLLFVWMLFVLRKPQKVKQFNIVFAAERPYLPETTHYAYNFFSHYQKAFGFLVVPRAQAFWDSAGEWSRTLSSAIGSLYTGNGQTYVLHIVLYVVVLYFMAAGV